MSYINRDDKLNGRDQYGRTPYMVAVLRGFRGTAKMFKDAGASTDMQFGFAIFNLEPTPLQCLSWLGRSDMIAELLVRDMRLKRPLRGH
jgi:hypothetical protein